MVPEDCTAVSHSTTDVASSLAWLHAVQGKHKERLQAHSTIPSRSRLIAFYSLFVNRANALALEDTALRDERMQRSIVEREGVDACSALVRHTVNNAAYSLSRAKHI